ncbi:MAG: hypothetical protein AB4042_15210 [Leptolyngbyaceae cyanobacterium]
MAVDLYELDAIRNYKKAIAALEGYADKIIDDFLEAPEGQAYIQANPDEEEYVGEWFLSILTLIYKNDVVTLPHITPSILEPILTQTLPSTLPPDEAADAGNLIPELIAFWSYLQRAYRLSTAPDIIRCLRSIQPIFNALVLGGATSSIKRSPKSSGSRQPSINHNRLEDKQMSSLVRSLDALGDIDIDDIDENDLKDLDDFDLDEDDLIDNDTESNHLDDEDHDQSHHHAQSSALLDMDVDRGITRPTSKANTNSNSAPTQKISVQSSVASNPMSPTAEPAQPHGTQPNENGRQLEGTALSENKIATLTQQVITEDGPGVILHDFQVLLAAVGEPGIAVSGKTQFLPMKILADLNTKMRYSVKLDLKRPLQKNYPNIHGLCLLLKASGLGFVASKGKKNTLQLHPELVNQWTQFNPTEQYFTLLNAWMIQATPAMIGEPNYSRPVGEDCLQAWCRCLPNPGHRSLSGVPEIERLGRMSGWHNVALLHLFGLLNVTDATPAPGQGWCVQAVERSPLGDAVMQVIQDYYYPDDFKAYVQRPAASSSTLNDLQAKFQPYFPEWQQCLTVASASAVDGVYVFKVTLREAIRWIAISGDQSLFELSQTILDAVNFDHDHLDMFRYRLPSGGYAKVFHPYSQESPASTDVLIRDLGLSAGSTLTYLFDFGDNWQFGLEIESIDESDRRSHYTEVLRAEGIVPEQYPEPC